MKRILLAWLLIASVCYAGRPLQEDIAKTIIVGPLLLPDGTPVTAPAGGVAAINCRAYKNDGTPVTIPLTATGLSANDMVHQYSGYYSLELTAADVSTAGYLRLTFYLSGNLIYDEDFDVLTAQGYGTQYSSTPMNSNITLIEGVTPAVWHAANQFNGYSNVVFVPHTGVDATSGTNLRNAITAAGSNTLIRIGIGNYDVGNTLLTVTNFVSVAGVDRESSIISSSLTSGHSFQPGQLSVFEKLTLRNTSTGDVFGVAGSTAMANCVVRDARIIGEAKGVTFTSSGPCLCTLEDVIMRPKTIGLLVTTGNHEIRLGNVRMILFGTAATAGFDIQGGANVRGGDVTVSLPESSIGAALRAAGTSKVQLYDSQLYALTNSINIANTATVIMQNGEFNRNLVTGVTANLADSFSPIRSTVPYRTVDVTATGGVGLDWANVENPTTTLVLSNTTFGGINGITFPAAFNTLTLANINSAIVNDNNLQTTALTNHVNSRTLLSNQYATATALATTDAIIDNIFTAYELDGTVYRLTTNALEQTPPSTVNTAAISSAVWSEATRTITGTSNGAIKSTSFDTAAINANAVGTDTFGADEIAPSGGTELGTAVWATAARTITGGTISTYTGNTPQSGDVYPRLGAPAGLTIAADIGAKASQTSVDNLPSAVWDIGTRTITGGTITTYTGDTPQTGDAYARLGAPSGLTIAADIGTRASQTSVDGVPTTSEFDARTLVAAEYATTANQNAIMQANGPSVVFVPRTGETIVRYTFTILSASGVYDDPDGETINLAWFDPSGGTLPAGLPATATRDAAGRYHADITIPSTADAQQRIALTASGLVDTDVITHTLSTQLSPIPPTTIEIGDE